MNLFVGNLPSDVTEEEVRSVFNEIGEVALIKIIKDPESGKCKGYGFVEMVDTEEAIIAMKVLNGRQMGEKFLSVNFAEQKEKPQDNKRGGGFNKGGGQGYNRQGGGGFNKGGGSNFNKPGGFQNKPRPTGEGDSGGAKRERKPYVPKAINYNKEGRDNNNQDRDSE